MNKRQKKKLNFFRNELDNFQEMARYIKPMSGDVPDIDGIDIYGEAIPFNEVVGGDHIVYVDFNKRYDLDHRIREAQKGDRPVVAKKLRLNKSRAGILLADVSGHNITDALLAAMLHQAFLIGVLYELKTNGEVTAELFEVLNTRFFNSSSFSKFITLIYGEIHSSGKFRFINAGHPLPVVYSARTHKISQVCKRRVLHFPPIGTIPSRDDIDYSRNVSRLGAKKQYAVNEINLMEPGDILLLYSDGFSEHTGDDDEPYFPDRLEKTLEHVGEKSAREIYEHLKKDLMSFAPPVDDVTFVVIKKN